MSDVTGIPAAWYPDPADAHRQRYWDGSGWTEQLRDAAPVEAPLSAADPTDEFESRDSGYVPFTLGASVASPISQRSTRGSASTLAIWLYTLVPLLLLLHQYFPWDFSPTDFVNAEIHGGLALGTLVVAVLLTAIDRTQLRNRGFQRTPPAILGVLPPVHMIARMLAVGAGAVLVTLAALIVQGVVVVVLLSAYLPSPVADEPAADAPSAEGMTAPFTPEQITYLLTSEGMAQKILFDAQENSLHYDDVECEPLTSIELGAQTHCHATGSLASYDLLIQVIPDGSNVPFAILSASPVME